MKETKRIVDAVAAFGPDDAGVLATVVDLKGSSYRLPGARMLILPDGTTAGTVSGGCVEADILERAARVLETGAPEIFRYDTTEEQGSVFSLNMGCRGIVRVLLEKVVDGSRFIGELSSAWGGGGEKLVATCIDSNEGGLVGERLFMRPDGSLPDGESSSLQEALASYQIAPFTKGERPARVETVPETGIELFVERLMAAPALYIFGAGADAIPLAAIASEAGYRVRVVDHRPAYADKDRFPAAESLLVCRPQESGDKINLTDGDAAVVMSHNFGHDREYLRALLGTKAAYVGLLGPRSRTDELIEGLRSEGVVINDSQSERIYAPVGLDIGASDPENIAIAILAEIRSVTSGRAGGSLRNRTGSIYGRAD